METKRTSIKAIIVVTIIFVVTAGIIICIKKPQMHKPFNFNVTEYFLNINKDGSATFTKQVTTMEVKEK